MSEGPLPLLPNTPGEDNPVQTASGQATSSLIVTTGSAGNQPGESSGQKSKQAFKGAAHTQHMSKPEKFAKFAKTTSKRYSSELRLVWQCYQRLPTDYASFKGSCAPPKERVL